MGREWGRAGKLLHPLGRGEASRGEEVGVSGGVGGGDRVTIDQVCHVYRRGQTEIEALTGVSIDVHGGEITVIVGPSGCGKSTLLDLVAGLNRPSSGIITRNGRPVVGPQKDIGYAFQRPALFPWLTVSANVTLGLVAQGMGRRAALESVGELLEVVGLKGFESAYPHELSGGMAQRVGIARAFARRPRLLLLDEPFASVDAYMRLILQQELLHLIAHAHSTVMFVTHDVNEAVFLGDKIVVLAPRPGRVLSVMTVSSGEKDRRSAAFAAKTAAILELLGVNLDLE